MRVIKDSSKLLPIEALEIHFLLPSSQYEKYSVMLESLNKADEFNLAPYHISVHDVGDGKPSGFLGSLPELKGANVFTRLIDESNDYYSYGCGRISLDGHWKKSLREIETFIYEAHEGNIGNAQTLMSSESGHYHHYRQVVLDRILRFLYKKIVLPPQDESYHTKGSPFLESDDVFSRDAGPVLFHNFIAQSPRESSEEARYRRISEQLGLDLLKSKSRSNRNKISYIGDAIDALLNEESRDAILKILYGDPNKVKIDEEGFPIKHAQGKTSSLTIGLGEIDNPRLRVRQCVRIEIDDIVHMVQLRTKYAVFYYALCLIFHKKGIPFDNNILLGLDLHGYHDSWEPETQWLRDLYRLIFCELRRTRQREFLPDNVVDSDFRNMIGALRRIGLRDTKSKCNSRIQTALEGEDESLIRECLINRGERVRNGSVQFGFPKECIQLPPKYDELLETFPVEFAQYIPLGFAGFGSIPRE